MYTRGLARLRGPQDYAVDSRLYNNDSLFKTGSKKAEPVNPEGAVNAEASEKMLFQIGEPPLAVVKGVQLGGRFRPGRSVSPAPEERRKNFSETYERIVSRGQSYASHQQELAMQAATPATPEKAPAPSFEQELEEEEKAFVAEEMEANSGLPPDHLEPNKVLTESPRIVVSPLHYIPQLAPEHRHYSMVREKSAALRHESPDPRLPNATLDNLVTPVIPVVPKRDPWFPADPVRGVQMAREAAKIHSLNLLQMPGLQSPTKLGPLPPKPFKTETELYELAHKKLKEEASNPFVSASDKRSLSPTFGKAASPIDPSTITPRVAGTTPRQPGSSAAGDSPRPIIPIPPSDTPRIPSAVEQYDETEKLIADFRNCYHVSTHKRHLLQKFDALIKKAQAAEERTKVVDNNTPRVLAMRNGENGSSSTYDAGATAAAPTAPARVSLTSRLLGRAAAPPQASNTDNVDGEHRHPAIPASGSGSATEQAAEEEEGEGQPRQMEQVVVVPSPVEHRTASCSPPGASADDQHAVVSNNPASIISSLIGGISRRSHNAVNTMPDTHAHTGSASIETVPAVADSGNP